MEPINPTQVITSGAENREYPIYPGILPKSDRNLGLSQFWPILNHRIRFMTAITLGLAASALWWTWQPESKYIGKFYLLLAPISLNSSATPAEITEEEMKIATQAEILRSPQVLEPIFKQLSVTYPDLNYPRLIQSEPTKSSLKIQRLERTKILEISYVAQDGRKIEVVLNELAKGYLDYHLKSQQLVAARQSGIIDQEVTQVRQRIAQSQKQLEQLRQQYNLYNPEQEAKLLSEQRANLEMETYQTQIRLQEAITLYKALGQQLKVSPQGAIASSDLSASAYYQDLLKQRQEIELQLAQESTIFLDTSPNIQALKEKQQTIQAFINQEEAKVAKNNQTQLQATVSSNPLRLSLSQQYIQVANTIQTLQSRKATLDAQIKAVNTQIQQLPLLLRQYTDLQQKFNRETTNLNHFLDTQTKLQSATSQVPPWEILSSPQLSEYSVSPNPQKNLVLGLLTGLSLGLMLSVLAEMLVSPALYKKS